jgi:hypothetical protein
VEFPLKVSHSPFTSRYRHSVPMQGKPEGQVTPGCELPHPRGRKNRV